MKNRRRAREGIGLKEVREKVPKHHHCPVCGVPISLNRETCSKECEERFKKIRRTRVIPVLIIIGAIIFMVIRWLFRF